MRAKTEANTSPTGRRTRLMRNLLHGYWLVSFPIFNCVFRNQMLLFTLLYYLLVSSFFAPLKPSFVVLLYNLSYKAFYRSQFFVVDAQLSNFIKITSKIFLPKLTGRSNIVKYQTIKQHIGVRSFANGRKTTLAI